MFPQRSFKEENNLGFLNYSNPRFLTITFLLQCKQKISVIAIFSPYIIEADLEPRTLTVCKIEDTRHL